MKKIITWGLAISPLLVILYGMRPIYKPDLDSCIIQTGTIVKVQEGGELDIVVILNEKPGSYYYINRGLENSFEVQEVMNWEQKNTKVWFVDRWTLRMLGNTTWHIARLDIDGEIVYDETVELPIP